MDPSTPAPPDPETAPIFVIGASRSGTTLLRMMLSAHSRIHLTMEASFYIWGALYTRWRDQDRFPPFYVDTFSFRWLGEDPGPILRELPRPFRFEDRKRLYAAVMRTQAARRGKPRWGDKTPGHSAHLARIFADWPDARVIRMVRDPREVIGSLVKMPWSSRSLILSAALTDWERRQVSRYRDRILEVPLRDLLTAPQPTMARVLAHVGEAWDDRVLDHATFGPDDLPPMPWFESAGGARNAPSGPPRHLTPTELRLIERLNGKGLRDQGLLPVPLEVEPGWRAVAMRYLQDLPVAGGGLLAALRLFGASRSGSDHARTAQLLVELNPPAWDAAGGFRMPEPPPLPADWREAWG